MEVERSLFSLHKKVNFFRYTYVQGTHACECDCYMSPSMIQACHNYMLLMHICHFGTKFCCVGTVPPTVHIWQRSYIWASLLEDGHWSFRLSTGPIVAAQNGGGLPSRPAFPSSPGTVLTVDGWLWVVSKAQSWGGVLLWDFDCS